MCMNFLLRILNTFLRNFYFLNFSKHRGAPQIISSAFIMFVEGIIQTDKVKSEVGRDSRLHIRNEVENVRDEDTKGVTSPINLTLTIGNR